jgi:hypothetical protein
VRVVYEKPSYEVKTNAAEEYLTIGELAARLKVKPKTIKNKMASGVFRKGVHYVRPQGLRPRFKWSAIVAWLEEKERETTREGSGTIPMARGYLLGNPGIDEDATSSVRQEGNRDIEITA